MEDSHKICRLKLLGRLWTLVTFKTFDLRGILTLGAIRDPGKQTPRFNLIEEWLIKNG